MFNKSRGEKIVKTLKFKCTLLTDIILNMKSASEGANSTLDFIPGNCFLGIVANKFYDEKQCERTKTLFHSGEVRFGDAHPAKESNRGLRIPAAFYYAKGDKITDACYIHHYITDIDNIKAKNDTKAQLKQCREGFYIMTEKEGKQINIDKSFALKSAYDRDNRRSKESAMYGYESLPKNMELLFSVEMDDSVSDEIENNVKDALIGEQRIGRSRSAQYGLVKIEEYNYNEIESYNDTNTVVVYADARLIFLDEANAQPTFRPTPQQLLGGDAKGKISWEKSQIRTFQYAPWNYKRQCYDTDRCGIEKGSVIVIEGVDKQYQGSKYVGNYRNEGFGKVIYNPIFMKAEGNGLAKCKFKEATKENKSGTISTSESNLFKYLKSQEKETKSVQNIYKNVNEWDGAKLFIDKEKFASQWGAIRNIALQCKNDDDIKNKIEEYISHGVKKEDWYGERTKKLMEFMDNNKDNLWAAIINLSSEMAKKCSKNGK